MERYGQGAYDYFTHSPSNFSWQRRAVKSLKDLRVPITMKDVLTPDDYRVFVRRYGEG
jgi:Leu/Phe-tRNA-protein transferase